MNSSYNNMLLFIDILLRLIIVSSSLASIKLPPIPVVKIVTSFFLNNILHQNKTYFALLYRFKTLSCSTFHGPFIHPLLVLPSW